MHSLKETGSENLQQSLALPVYFMVLNFDYGARLAIIHVSKFCLNFLFIGCDFTR